MRMHTRRRWALLLAVTVVAGATVAGALAAFPDTDVATYTGCLSGAPASNGQIMNVAPGSQPLKPCGSKELLVHLGGGDITKVVAGEGLTGGGDNGAVTLGLDSGHSLPQACSAGQVSKSDGSSGWTCAEDGGNAVWFAQKTLILVDDQPVTPATLSVPAGTYYVNVTGEAFNVSDGDVDLGCQLFENNVGPPIALTATADTESPGRSIGSLAMSAVASSSEPIRFRVTCSSFQDGSALRLHAAAIRVGTAIDQSE